MFEMRCKQVFRSDRLVMSERLHAVTGSAAQFADGNQSHVPAGVSATQRLCLGQKRNTAILNISIVKADNVRLGTQQTCRTSAEVVNLSDPFPPHQVSQAETDAVIVQSYKHHVCSRNPDDELKL